MRQRLKILKFTLTAMITAAVLSVYFSILLGNEYDTRYYSGFSASVILIAAAYFTYRLMTRYKNLMNIEENWGLRINRKRRFKELKEIFEKYREGFFIDDQTWQDLNLEDIYSIIDRTYTTPGEQVLYEMLRTPSLSKEVLKKRNRTIEYFQDNQQVREKLQMELIKLDRSDINGLNDLLYEGIQVNKSLNITISILSILPVLALCTIPFLKLGTIMLIVPLFIINMSVHYKLKNSIGSVVKSSRYLGSIVGAAQRISSVQGLDLSDYKNVLKEYSESCRKIVRSAYNIGYIEGIDVIFDYLKIMFLIEERGYFNTARTIEKHKKELQGLYNLIGELDSFISIASFREGLEYFCIPDFVEEGRVLKLDKVSHPLIEDAVPNSIDISEHGIIITGSNMSGKSTFLRTVGVNAILAQTIVTCKAEGYKGSFFRTITSISPEDNILSGRSYYLGEAEALLRIIKSLDGNPPVLCIIDEIFRGTNPVERISASLEILKYLIVHNCIPIVATHDLELTEMVSENYSCCYFTEDVDEAEGLKFDYTIRKGVSPTRNAIKLLKYLGYPEEIVNSALQGIK